MRKQLLLLNSAVPLHSLLKPTSIYVYIYIFRIRYRYLYNGGSRWFWQFKAIWPIALSFGNWSNTADKNDARMRNITKSSGNSIVIRHCIYTIVTISEFYVHIVLQSFIRVSFIEYRVSRFRWYTHLACGEKQNSRSKFNFSSRLYSFFLFTSPALFILYLSWIIIHDSCIPLAALRCHGSWSLVSLWNHSNTLKRDAPIFP